MTYLMKTDKIIVILKKKKFNISKITYITSLWYFYPSSIFGSEKY